MKRKRKTNEDLLAALYMINNHLQFDEKCNAIFVQDKYLQLAIYGVNEAIVALETIVGRKWEWMDK